MKWNEASQKCFWLRSLIRCTCGLSYSKMTPTVIYEDNIACNSQLKEGYIKGDRTKHISPKFFFTRDLQKDGEIDINQIRSSENLADMFSQSHFLLQHLRSLLMALDFADLEISTEVVKRGRWYTLYSFSLVYGFFPLGFPSKVFNEAAPISVSLSIVLFFLPLSFCPIGFYLVGVFLMRHMFSLGHPRGSVMKSL